jgi:hypothetical protein
MIEINSDLDERVPHVEEHHKVDFEMARYVDWAKAKADARRERLQTVGIGIIILIFVIIAIGCAAIAKKTASATEDVAQVEEGEHLDGSTAGANAVTLEDITNGSRHGGEVEWPVGRVADNGVTFYDAQDGPFPVLPIGWQSFEIYDIHNNSYTVVYDTRGGAMAIVPTLDEQGQQKQVPFG